MWEHMVAHLQPLGLIHIVLSELAQRGAIDDHSEHLLQSSAINCNQHAIDDHSEHLLEIVGGRGRSQEIVVNDGRSLWLMGDRCRSREIALEHLPDGRVVRGRGLLLEERLRAEVVAHLHARGGGRHVGGGGKRAEGGGRRQKAEGGVRRRREASEGVGRRRKASGGVGRRRKASGGEQRWYGRSREIVGCWGCHGTARGR